MACFRPRSVADPELRSGGYITCYQAGPPRTISARITPAMLVRGYIDGQPSHVPVSDEQGLVCRLGGAPTGMPAAPEAGICKPW